MLGSILGKTKEIPEQFLDQYESLSRRADHLEKREEELYERIRELNEENERLERNLRDDIAIKYMLAIVENDGGCQYINAIAEEAYEMADAMMEAREGENDE